MKRSLRTLMPAMLVVLAGLAGCSVASVETPDPAAIPTGSLEAAVAAATGPIVELGSGVMLEHRLALRRLPERRGLVHPAGDRPRDHDRMRRDPAGGGSSIRLRRVATIRHRTE